jgi:hypothetical protein
MKNATLISLLCSLLLCFSPPAQAYLDPGSGSMLVQLLLGGVAGLAVIARMYWQKLKLFFMCRGSLNQQEADNQDLQATDDTKIN